MHFRDVDREVSRLAMVEVVGFVFVVLHVADFGRERSMRNSERSQCPWLLPTNGPIFYKKRAILALLGKSANAPWGPELRFGRFLKVKAAHYHELHSSAVGFYF